MRLSAEFTTEPFLAEGDPPAHATEPFEAARSAGLAADLGPFGTTLSGDGDDLLAALGPVLAAAFAHGATRVTMRVERADG